MIPLCLLCVLTISSGFIFHDIMIGEGLDSWNSSIYFSYLDFSTISLAYRSFFLFNYEFNEYIRGITFFWVLYFILVFIIIYLFYRLFIFYIK